MEEMNKTELILSLIQDNLINLKLIYGLELIGLISHDYYLNLGNTIFKLMGFEENAKNDLIFEKVFVGNSERVIRLRFSDSKTEFVELSKEIYEELVFAKGICEGCE
jgi:hypothetical protein